MPAYGNAANSSISSFIITDDGIDITFHKGRTYSYTRGYNDDTTIGIMIDLAEAGSGLNSFINKERPTYS
jgi:hypothetical protein